MKKLAILTMFSIIEFRPKKDRHSKMTFRFLRKELLWIAQVDKFLNCCIFLFKKVNTETGKYWLELFHNKKNGNDSIKDSNYLIMILKWNIELEIDISELPECHDIKTFLNSLRKQEKVLLFLEEWPSENIWWFFNG